MEYDKLIELCEFFRNIYGYRGCENRECCKDRKISIIKDRNKDCEKFSLDIEAVKDNITRSYARNLFT